jgi:DNA-binding transcriptional regulator YiaG
MPRLARQHPNLCGNAKGTRIARSALDMETAPGKVIRSLRQALQMSQAEFARAAGWSPSTISSWERGTSRPSRLAFKTILAFAEERGVRYQAKSEPSGPDGTAAPASALPMLRMSSRLPAAPVEIVAPERPRSSSAREESFGSRRWTDYAATGVAGSYDAYAGARPRPSAWQAEATLHVKIGAGTRPSRRGGWIVAGMAAVLVGLGIGTLLRSATSPHDAVGRVAAARSVENGSTSEPLARVDALEAPEVAGDALPGTAEASEPSDEPFPSGIDPVPVAAAAMAPAPVALLARLESIVSLDGIRRASFRVGDRSIALVEGDQLGAHAVAKIANEDVTLVGGADGPHRVPLGFETPLE